MFVRVAAVNPGGTGIYSEHVGARVAPGSVSPLLLVGGFDRHDRFVKEHENPHHWLVVDGAAVQAVTAAGYPFDGCSNEAVENTLVSLGGYGCVGCRLCSQHPPTGRRVICRIGTWVNDRRLYAARDMSAWCDILPIYRHETKGRTMYSLVKKMNHRTLLTQQLPTLAVSLLIAEFAFKFGSFSLEALAFLGTWFVLDFIVTSVTSPK